MELQLDLYVTFKYTCKAICHDMWHNDNVFQETFIKIFHTNKHGISVFVLQHIMQQHIEDTYQITVYTIKIKSNAYIVYAGLHYKKLICSQQIPTKLPNQETITTTAIQKLLLYMYSTHFCLFICNYILKPEGLMTN
jgi:hypothetical protein